MSQIQRAVEYLKAHSGQQFSAQLLKSVCGLTAQESTIGRKLRDKAAKGIISRTYKRIAGGEEIAVYYWPDPLKEAANRDALAREAAGQMNELDTDTAGTNDPLTQESLF